MLSTMDTNKVAPTTHRARWRRPLQYGALSIAIALACSGCLYFNLFYNAEIAFDTSYKAQQKLLKDNPDSILALPADIETGYKKAIDKSLKVFELYPKEKKWHDKAMFLIGKSNFYLGDYDKAIRSFAELQREFPASPLVPESFLYIGRSYLKKGNLDEAEKTFELASVRYPELNKNQDVTMLKVEITIRREGKSKAVAVLESAYKTAKTSDRKMELAIKIAQLCRDLKLYDKAIGYLRGSPRVKDLTDQLYRIDYLLVTCLTDKEDYKQALALVDVMLVQKPYYSHVPVLLVRKAEILDRLGRLDDAIAIYKQVTESANGGDAIGVAWFELACLYQTRKGDLQKAKDCYDKAVGVLKEPDLKDIATRRSKAIDLILKFGKGKMPSDTSKTAEPSSPEFKIGELFWVELGQPDSAYRHYCATACDTHYRAQKPKALYAASWIARYSLKDSVRADSLYKLLLFGFPSNVYTQKAQEARGDKKTVFTRLDSAQASFEAAEKIFLDDEKPDSAAEAYLDVYKKFPETECGPKSLYASAWIYDNVLDKNRTAKGIYELLCDSFPKCTYCVNEAKPRLKTVADSLAALRNRRKSMAAASAPGKLPQVVGTVSKNPADTALPLITDKDSSARRGLQPGGPPPGYSRGSYRGMPPQIPLVSQPSTTAQPGQALSAGAAVLPPSGSQKFDTSSHASAASLPAAGSGDTTKHAAAPMPKRLPTATPTQVGTATQDSTARPAALPSSSSTPADTSKHAISQAIAPAPGQSQPVAAKPDSLSSQSVLPLIPAAIVDSSKRLAPSPTIVPAIAPVDTSKHIAPSPVDTTSNPIKLPSPPK